MFKKIIILLFIFSSLALPQKSNAENHQSGNWYLGLGLGVGLDARYEKNNQYTITFDEAMDANMFDKSTKMAANIKAGIKINSNIRLGLDYTTIRQEGTSDTSKGSLQINNYFLMLTHFPSEEGFFIRAGGGKSDFIATHITSGSTGTKKIHGYGVLGGAGYALWLGEKLNVSFNLDYSRQFYSGHNGDPDGSSFTALYLGFGIN